MAFRVDRVREVEAWARSVAGDHAEHIVEIKGADRLVHHLWLPVPCALAVGIGAPLRSAPLRPVLLRGLTRVRRPHRVHLPEVRAEPDPEPGEDPGADDADEAAEEARELVRYEGEGERRQSAAPHREQDEEPAAAEDGERDEEGRGHHGDDVGEHRHDELRPPGDLPEERRLVFGGDEAREAKPDRGADPSERRRKRVHDQGTDNRPEGVVAELSHHWRRERHRGPETGRAFNQVLKGPSDQEHFSYWVPL
mmetsp:Transcript_11642/g.27651  ORF Transcript_11642/g.27651 Transcript_11642/m.27651 type:complete len:252 (-) Transcript_11642:609-1364(-)